MTVPQWTRRERSCLEKNRSSVMPMPHRTQQQLIKRRLKDKDGTARIRELRAILSELPNYRNGPYADLRRWVNEEIERSRVRHRSVHRDAITVKRQGAAQIALVGAPNAGKSSLLEALSGVQIAIGDYAFTTTRPIPAVIHAGGILVQLVEIPGLIAGAADDRGGGRALLGVLRNADHAVVCHAADAPADALITLLHELEQAGLGPPDLVVITKADELDGAVPPAVRAATVDVDVTTVSVLDDSSLDRLRQRLFTLTGLVRIHVARDGQPEGAPVALAPPVTVADVAATIHGDLAAACRGARLWGASARFPGQRVGPGHRLADEDTVEILT